MLTSYLPVCAETSWVSIVSPGPGEVLAGRRAEVSVSFNTGSAQKVTRVDIDVEGQRCGTRNLAEPTSKGISSFLVDTTRFANGVRSIVVKVYSGTVLIGSASSKSAVSNSTIDVLPPTIKFVGVTQGKVVSGTTEIEVSARDGSDKDPLVSVMVDKSLKLIRNTPPYRYSWNTAEYENGRHTLHAYAYDEAGNRGDAQEIEVTVRNAGASIAEVPAETPKVAAVEAPKSAAIETQVVVRTETARPAVIPMERTASQTSAARTATPSVSSAQTNTVSARPDKVFSRSERAVAPAQQSDSIVARPAWTEKVIAKPVESRPQSVSRQSEASVKPTVVETRSQSTARVSEPRPARLPERKPAAETIQTAQVARIDQPVLMAELPHPTLSSGPDPEEPEFEPATPASATTPNVARTSGAGDVAAENMSGESSPASALEPSVPLEPAIASDAPRAQMSRSELLSERGTGMRLAQKIAQPKAQIPEPIKMARSPQPEPLKYQPAPDPKTIKVRLMTVRHKGTVITGLRFAIESAGGRIIAWDKRTRTVLARFGNKTVKFQVGQPIASVDGQQVKLSCAPFIAGRGRMMVDVQALKEVLGAKLEADERTGEWRIVSA